MASLKFLIIACALVLVQVQAHPQPQVKLTDTIKIVVPMIQRAIDMILEDSGKAFERAAEDPVAYQVKFMDTVVVYVDEILGLPKDLIDLVEEYGDASSVKIAGCVQGAITPTREVLLGFVNRTTKCMAPEVQDLMQELSDVQPDLQVIKTKVFFSLDKVQDCSETKPKEAQCLAGITNEILDILRNTQREVKQEMLEAISSVIEKMRVLSPKCVSPNVEQAKKEALKTLDSIAICATA